MRTLSVCVLAALIATFSNSALSEGWRESDFECAGLGRRLDDQELLEKLRTAIQEHWVGAANLDLPTISTMQMTDPTCCRVVSDPEKNPWADDWEKDNVPWWRRLLESPRIFAVFRYEDPPRSGVSYSGHGLLSTCGDILHMSFARKN
jgi:hypothetical protein